MEHKEVYEIRAEKKRFRKAGMKKYKMAGYALAALLCFFAATLVYQYLAIQEAGGREVYSSAEEAPAATVAIIPGAGVYAGERVSPVLADRLVTGVELYQAGKVKKILLTGDHGQTDYDEVNAMRKFVLDLGVPEEDVFMDHAGFSTYDSMYRARDIFQVRDAVIVTQQFHLPRALYIARELGIESAGLEADKRRYVGARYLKFREALAGVKAFLQLHVFKSKPKYLGETIPITGDGRVTWD